LSNSLFNLVVPSLDVDHAEQPWPLIRAGIVATLLLTGAVSIWVWLAPISGAVIGPGVVKVDMNRKTVQHQEGGIVSEILVRDGSKVKAGQTLIVLRDVRVDAGNEAVRTQLDAELAKAARLSAEITNKEVSFPAELLDRGTDPRVTELLKHESTLFRVRREALSNQVLLLQSQAREARDEIKARTKQMKADEEAIRFQKEELAANASLADKGFVSKTRLLTLQREVAQYESRRAEGAAELARAQQKVSDLELRAETLRSSFVQEASKELRQSTAAIFELRERLRPAQDAEKRQRIVAPIAGEVVDLKITTVGAVIAPREPILDIFPENADLLIEARVRPEDMSFVNLDARADVRLTGFRRRLTPTVSGTVTYISADRLVDKERNNMPYYAVHVRVLPASLKEANLHLQAGMPAEVFIRTTARSALEYLVDPIVAFLQRSMREQ